MASSGCAFGLARVERIARAMAADISRHGPIQNGHTSIAVRAMKPGTRTAKSTPGPGHANVLRHGAIVQFQDNTVTRNAHFRDFGPADGINAACDPMISERIGALEL